MSRLVLDSIIFGLQRFGGISNFWTRLVDASCDTAPGRVELLMPRSIRAHALPDLTGKIVHTERLSPQLSRYVPAWTPERDLIFHTSYYRRPRRLVDRYIASVYDFTYERYISGVRQRVHHHQKRAAIMAADMSVCISEATRTDLLACFPKVDPARTCVIPLGVDRSRFYPDSRNPSGRPYVLFVGQRSGYKRFDLAIGAVSLLKGLRLAIVGPPLSDREKAWLEKALPGRWIEHGGVDGNTLRHLYSDAYAFVFPSDYEGFGLPILEAMACGCPTVAASLSSFPEVAGGAALLAQSQTSEAYATLLAQLEDSEGRARLISAGEARVALFGWAQTFERFADCYR